ncbi:MAG: ATP-binding protein [Deltaproteobacteria bacterium]|nr:ATP-binding protein [Deltaproteobacteria bacterium]
MSSSSLPDQLPSWAQELRQRYLAGEASVFLLHGNTRDVQPGDDGQYVALRVFLERLFGRTKDIVAYYNVAEGIEFPSSNQRAAFLSAVNAVRTVAGRESVFDLPRTIGGVLPVVEDVVTSPAQNAAIILDYVETIAPNADLAFMGDAEKANLVTLMKLGADPGLLAGNSVVVLVTEQLGDVSRRLVAQGHVATLEIPLPDEARRRAFLDREIAGVPSELSVEQLATVTAGLSLNQVRGLLRQARQGSEAITFRVVSRRKKTIIEQECHGLVEFVDPHHSFDDVGGNSSVKATLQRVAEAIKAGRRSAVPMGVIFVGPMGTGKTFVAEAFAASSGLTCLKFKNFREKWVGSTEANLERILHVVDALGYALLIIDEADRSLSGGHDGDGGTSSRVIARLKEFMSDTRHRGRVLVVMMTNRPDKLDTDLKRPGRFDLKIPFFFPETSGERAEIGRAIARRAGLLGKKRVDWATIAEKAQGYSAAEIEAVVLAAANLAGIDGRDTITTADLSAALADVVPSRDVRMLEFMEMLAVFESSSRGMLPARYRDMATEEVLARLDQLRARLGGRV